MNDDSLLLPFLLMITTIMFTLFLFTPESQPSQVSSSFSYECQMGRSDRVEHPVEGVLRENTTAIKILPDTNRCNVVIEGQVHDFQVVVIVTEKVGKYTSVIPKSATIVETRYTPSANSDEYANYIRTELPELVDAATAHIMGDKTLCSGEQKAIIIKDGECAEKEDVTILSPVFNSHSGSESIAETFRHTCETGRSNTNPKHAIESVLRQEVENIRFSLVEGRCNAIVTGRIEDFRLSVTISNNPSMFSSAPHKRVEIIETRYTPAGNKENYVQYVTIDLPELVTMAVLHVTGQESSTIPSCFKGNNVVFKDGECTDN